MTNMKHVYRILALVETNENPRRLEEKIKSMFADEESIVTIPEAYVSWKQSLEELIGQKGW